MSLRTTSPISRWLILFNDHRQWSYIKNQGFHCSITTTTGWTHGLCLYLLLICKIQLTLNQPYQEPPRSVCHDKCLWENTHNFEKLALINLIRLELIWGNKTDDTRQCVKLNACGCNISFVPFPIQLQHNWSVNATHTCFLDAILILLEYDHEILITLNEWINCNYFTMQAWLQL